MPKVNFGKKKKKIKDNILYTKPIGKMVLLCQCKTLSLFTTTICKAQGMRRIADNVMTKCRKNETGCATVVGWQFMCVYIYIYIPMMKETSFVLELT